MVEVKKYYLPPTALMPNSPQPLLHYPGFLQSLNTEDYHRDSNSTKKDDPNTSTTTTTIKKDNTCSPVQAHDTFRKNNWRTQWIYRYGPTQTAHYHSRAHECMAVLSGTATIRFGVADTTPNLDESTYNQDHEAGGIELPANPGDVFVLPAGMAHKTFDTNPRAEFALLTPGDGHATITTTTATTATSANGDREEESGVTEDAMRDALTHLSLDGFTMIGAYPVDGAGWDFAKGGDSEGQYEQVWSVPKPERDPVLGTASEGLCGLWK